MAHLPLIAVIAFAQGADLTQVLKSIEARYNSIKTLQSNFEQSVTMQGKSSAERGVLYLRKPGQMRWEYAQPPGKLFLSDAKKIYYVSPASRRVEVSAVKETEDLRAPLAFLLGRLDFSRDFGRYESSQREGTLLVRAFPKNAKSVFEYVEFWPAADGTLRTVTVQGRDGSRMEYRFSNETKNPALSEKLFRFEAPPGFEIVDLKNAP
jgi:outer membrane lipoprotein carrier protein